MSQPIDHYHYEYDLGSLNGDEYISVITISPLGNVAWQDRVFKKNQLELFKKLESIKRLGIDAYELTQ